eukprot:CAMPEP_0170273890 /NCGR_PEP_ID=MMETSP0116_2-20130129/36915_1 /TAXON_ID=400756 /ORGANISM="Durinskia baltica, Strain CSIRO CS-38" /LENGTH=373 /DNA_ID=CAMNT_0010525133 /DNA_START=1 /DNA_END=1122 /DNA_ORIENTATION=+
MRATALRAAGRDVINWHVGRPDYDTPAHIKAAATAAMEAGHVHYAPAAGIPELREALAERSSLEWGTGVSADRVVVCNGGMEAVYASLAALIDPGDEVIVPTPNWPNMRWATRLAGGTPVEVPLEDGQLTAEAVAAKVTHRTRAVVLSSPGNPLGTVASPPDLAKIAQLAAEKDIMVFSDETYCRLYYGGAQDETAPSIMSMPGAAERTLAFGTFSKTYAMDGWRLGWLVAPTAADAVEITKARYYISSCSPTFTQHAAVVALRSSQDCVREMVEAYRTRRDALVEGLANIDGVSLPGGTPMGAYYLFPDISRFGDSGVVAKALLEEHGIACIDGAVFGKEGSGHLRIAYSCSLEDCRRGVDRLGMALNSMRS